MVGGAQEEEMEGGEAKKKGKSRRKGVKRERENQTRKKITPKGGGRRGNGRER